MYMLHFYTHIKYFSNTIVAQNHSKSTESRSNEI